MASASYMDGRIKYQRPQGMLWSDNPGTLVMTYSVTNQQATLAEDTAVVYISSGVDNIYPRQMITKISGEGEFGNGASIESVDRNNKTITLSKNHKTEGPIVFSVGDSRYVPDGTEYEDFIVLTDDNRSGLQLKPLRLEKRERTINGRMRSYHIADKMTLDVSWDMIPSRASSRNPRFNSSTGKPSAGTLELPYISHTTDNGAAGSEILDWYRNHVGPFWVYLAYDDYKVFGDDSAAYAHLKQYSQVMEMYISDFSYSVERRGSNGQSGYDFWNINVSLEEA
jgi:hypothetical protein